MLFNYFKIALRYIRKEGIYSIIKILGLSVGLFACLQIVLFVYEDLSFDSMHSKADRIVRVLTIDSAQGVQSQEVGVSQPALGPAAVEEIPEIVDAVRIAGQGEIRLKKGDKEFKTEQAIFSESSFFEIFDFEILNGQKENILDEPNSVVLTESLAKKIFGEESPLGQSLKLGDIELNIKAIAKDPPKNSHIQFDLVRSLVAPEDNPGWQQYLISWGGLSIFNYLLLDQPREDLQPIIDKLIDLKTKNEAAEFFTPTLQTLENVHLHSKHILFESNFQKTDISNVFIMISIGFIVLILASVNFMNLVTAKASIRAKEIGVRKALGGLRKHLIVQHLTETFVIVIFSAILAVLLLIVISPALNSIYHRFADPSILLTKEMMLISGAFLLFLSILAGSYPALVLSSFKPTDVLKGSFQSSRTGVIVRKGLVIFQFVISIALIIGAGVIFQQMNYIHTRDMGYNREQVVEIRLTGQGMMQKMPVFSEELRKISGVTGVSSASNRLGQQLGRNSIYPEGAGEEDNYITSAFSIDDSYIPTMEMEMVDGRNFSRDILSDTASAMIINEELARMLNWDDPVGRTIELNAGPDERNQYTVIGVVKDFNFATIQHPIEPLFLLYNRTNPVICLKIETGSTSKTLDEIRSVWSSIYPGSTFEYSFMDENFNTLYENEASFARMFSHLTFLAIFIAAMGLFGLSAYSTEQRRKEIGIRKVLGAGIGEIVFMLSKQFIWLVLIAFILSVPLAWMGMSRWLESFVYRINLGPGIFILSALLASLVALITVSWQSTKAALSNPVSSLKDE